MYVCMYVCVCYAHFFFLFSSISCHHQVMCEVCAGGTHEEVMLLCDKCGRGYHIFCLTPPLAEVPQGDWQCHKCQPGQGVYGFQDGKEVC